jgi:hypothetical protein
MTINRDMKNTRASQLNEMLVGDSQKPDQKAVG